MDCDCVTGREPRAAEPDTGFAGYRRGEERRAEGDPVIEPDGRAVAPSGRKPRQVDAGRRSAGT
ncbi:protein of unknown function [Methylococcus capsulatus]|uniref:Uncharacterized protein n=1 Tax=Methylococcus capsulatus TaxID=414 RepID=A0AA35V6Z8_METCP|nr:protein of unknown function [Methylococcus capsulatus]